MSCGTNASCIGITDDEVTAFDIAHLDADDPGDLPDAPYRWEHRTAMTVERLVAYVKGVDWDAYQQALDAVYQGAASRHLGDADRKSMINKG